VVTNQPDIARGKITREAADQINRYVCETAAVDAIELCAHDDADDCDCRKPKPGMLLRAARRDGISLGHSFMVGDRWRDIEAGRRAGCRTVLIGTGYDEKTDVGADATVGDLRAAVDWLLAQSGRAHGEA
jgi:D-glycero-D-manno-heptose 1,7-bisphosphate phosphatase